MMMEWNVMKMTMRIEGDKNDDRGKGTKEGLLVYL